jgi:hypothetical protein
VLNGAGRASTPSTSHRRRADVEGWVPMRNHPLHASDFVAYHPCLGFANNCESEI